MGNKRPQPMDVLIKRLRRVAKWLDDQATTPPLTQQQAASIRARANTCWQAAGRMDEALNLLIGMDHTGGLGHAVHARITDVKEGAK